MTKQKDNKKVLERIEKQLEDISRKLNCFIYVLGAQLPQEETQEERIVKLDKMGFNYKEIALILGTTPGTVSVTLSPSKRQKKKTKKTNAQTKTSS